ncbi:hypothetical protein CHS0354_006216 [Potamilus streckersoni]|uniref:C2H2-type domain-containing protein n=1 Tax=Potamilus streckersoni TaxID=2493646 RepID=A0AAE0SR29_9BIVA|nr:hypothetical protein CHS0354_006216 [Potamilus streckersoni]
METTVTVSKEDAVEILNQAAQLVEVKGTDETMQVIMLAFDEPPDADETAITHPITGVTNVADIQHHANAVGRIEHYTGPTVDRAIQTETVFSVKDMSVINDIVNHQYSKPNADNSSSGSNGTFSCSLCAKVYRNKSTWQNHLRTHNGQEISICGVCGRFFSDRVLLKSHLDNHREETQRLIISPLKEEDQHVGKIQKQPEEVAPVTSSFVNPPPVSEELEIPPIEEPTDSTTYIYACNICGVQYNTKKECEKHLKIHGGSVEDENDDLDEDEELEGTKELPKQTSLDIENQRKSPRKNQQLNSLVAKSASNSSAASSTAFIYACNVCGKQYTNKSNCKRHMRIHTGEEKTFECTHCHKKFAMKYELRMHSRIHTGEKPFECAVCGKTFVERGNWKRHTKIHLREQEDAPYRCGLCSKGFFYAEKLQVHLQIHSGQRPYVCTVCGKKSKKIGDMYRHLRIHTGEKPYECQVCGKGFAQNGNLKDHMKKHTGEKMFKCPQCEQRFSRKVLLRQHMATHHKAETDGATGTPLKDPDLEAALKDIGLGPEGSLTVIDGDDKFTITVIAQGSANGEEQHMVTDS